MSDLPDEMLNPVNKQLKSRIDTADHKLLMIREETVNEKYVLENQQQQLISVKKDMQTKANLIKVHEKVWEAESNQVNKIVRETCALVSEMKKQSTDEAALRIQTTEKENTLSKKQSLLDEFTRLTKITKEDLVRIVESQHSSEAKAIALSQMSDSDVKKYDNLLQQRDTLTIEVDDKIAKLREESEIIKSLIMQSEKTHSDIQQTLQERSHILNQLHTIDDVIASSYEQINHMKNNTKTTQTLVQEGLTTKRELSDMLLSTKSQTGQLSHISNDKKRIKESLLVKVDGLYDIEYQIEKDLESIKSVVLSARQELVSANTETDFLKQQLEQKRLIADNKESEHFILRDQLRGVLKTTESQYRMEQELESLKDRFTTKIKQAITTYNNLVRKMKDATTARNVAIANNNTIEQQLNSISIAKMKSTKQLTKAEQSSSEYLSIVRSLDAVKELKKQRLRQAENDSSHHNEHLIAEATSLRQQLEDHNRYGAALKSSVSSAVALYNRELTLFDNLVDDEESLKKNISAARSEISGLTTEIAKGNEQLLLSTKRKESMEITTKSTKDRARGVLIQLSHEEERREDLECELQGRLTDIDAHQTDLKFCLRKHEEEKRNLLLEYQNKTSQLDQVRSRYFTHMKSLYYAVIITEEETTDPTSQSTEGRDAEIEKQITELEPEEIQAKFITTLASVRMRLQERGDKLDQLLVKTSKEGLQVDKALSLIGNSNIQKKKENSCIAWKETTAAEKLSIKFQGRTDDEIQNLRLTCGQLQYDIDTASSVLLKYKSDLSSVRKDALQKQSDLSRLTKKLSARKRQVALVSKSPNQILHQLHGWVVQEARSNPTLYKSYRQLLDKSGLSPALSGSVGRSLSVTRIKPTATTTTTKARPQRRNSVHLKPSNPSSVMISGVALRR